MNSYFFRCDENKKGSGHCSEGVAIFIPKKLQVPGRLKFLTHFRHVLRFPSHFEGIWVEFSAIISQSNQKGM